MEKELLITSYERVKFSVEEQLMYEHLMPQAEERAEAFTAQIMGIVSESPEPWQLIECMFRDILRDKYYSEMITNYRLKGGQFG